ncbi:MAG: outer membrane beta-barrel protein [Desulfobulbaceae bacterium]|nr:outer membrane beta-barrel protein [Desulfobulbaceae bacterium]
MKKSLLFFSALFLLPSANSSADDFRVIPNAAIRQEYNDNVFFTRDNEDDDFITTASVGVDVRERTERLSALFKGRLDGLYYFDNDNLNDIEEYYDGKLDYQLNSFLKLSAGAGYSVDSRADRDISITGIDFGTDVRRRQSYSVSADYRFSEKTSLFSTYSYQNDQFEIDDTNEFTGQNVLVGLTRTLQFTKPTTARFYAQYSHYDFYTSKTQNYRLTAGVSRQVSEKLSYVVDAGPRLTEGKAKRSGETSSDSGLGGQFSLTYNEELTTAEMNFSHEISGSSGRDGATERTGLVFSLRHRFGERSSAQMRVSGYLNKVDRNTAFINDLEELTINFNPSVRYEINREFSLVAAYRHSRIEDLEDNTEKRRNLFYVKLNYQIPVIE